MAVKWTEKQQEVIDVRDKEVLVSAAAGSGKTAVLVEHIIQKITRKEQPLDVDALLVVTFTNAAAAEMRERILNAIEKKAAEDPENEHLQKQLTYIHHAKITTIDSFCLDVVRENFEKIDIDPAFRIADEGELKLLKADVLKEMLEEYYEAAEDDFIDFVESYTDKNDSALEELILQVYEFGRSYPDPEAWYISCMDNYDVKTREELYEKDWMKYLFSLADMYLEDFIDELDKGIRICMDNPGMEGYQTTLEADKVAFTDVIKAETLEEKSARIRTFSFDRMGRCKKDVPKEVSVLVKGIRDEIKKMMSEKIQKPFFSTLEDDVISQLEVSGKCLKVLLSMVQDFEKRFAQQKKENNLIDFGDLEHFALQILVEKDSQGNLVPTQTAVEMSEQFEEIMIDEYQDSNLVQETILRSISKERENKPNIFMVGDVKQSIYKFRLARPELFMDKYERYGKEESGDLYGKITLDRNFRSRKEVLDSVNFIFDKIMHKSLGNIEYDEENALYPGADFVPVPEGQDQRTELILLSDTEMEDESAEENSESRESKVKDDDGNEIGEAELGKMEMEAYAIAGRIRELTDEKNGFQVVDKKTGKYRTARYSDIVILFRSLKGWGDVFTETLMGEGIPTYCETSVGYFNALEISQLLSFLSVIDNPLQDIPFVAVLRSYFGGLSNTELAIIKSNTGGDGKEKLCWFKRVEEYLLQGENQEIKEKLSLLTERLDRYRKMVPYTSIYDLISKILEDTGYYNYVLAMPSGKRRAANLDILKQKAVDFENTSYVGLFHFIRYIEKLKKYEVDFGEARTVGENDNTVRIMSIHKSKGLEFPIVIMPGLEKNFNLMDTRGPLVIEPDLGIGMDKRDAKSRIKSDTVIEKVIAKKIELESKGEELRVLYVALTRAKEKLILSGSVKKPEETLGKWQSEQADGALSFLRTSSGRNYLEWIGYSMKGKENSVISMKILNQADLVNTAVKTEVQKEERKQKLLHPTLDHTLHPEEKQQMKEGLSYVYPFDLTTTIGKKYSVSDLKHAHLEEDEEMKQVFLRKDETIVPEFVEHKEKKFTGAALGTIYHRVFELYPLENARKNVDHDQVSEILAGMVQRKLISEEMKEVVSPEIIASFSNSELAKRMAAAQQRHQLFREQQFVMGVNANELNDDYPKEETVLIQGVIDVYFEEEDGLVLTDYKTDKVKEYDELVSRYKIQLDLYQEALEKMTGKKVKERIIYSTKLGGFTNL